jgi:hypothetical protein
MFDEARFVGFCVTESGTVEVGVPDWSEGLGENGTNGLWGRWSCDCDIAEEVVVVVYEE